MEGLPKKYFILRSCFLCHITEQGFCATFWNSIVVIRFWVFWQSPKAKLDYCMTTAQAAIERVALLTTGILVAWFLLFGLVVMQSAATGNCMSNK